MAPKKVRKNLPMRPRDIAVRAAIRRMREGQQPGPPPPMVPGAPAARPDPEEAFQYAERVHQERQARWADRVPNNDEEEEGEDDDATEDEDDGDPFASQPRLAGDDTVTGPILRRREREGLLGIPSEPATRHASPSPAQDQIDVFGEFDQHFDEMAEEDRRREEARLAGLSLDNLESDLERATIVIENTVRQSLIAHPLFIPNAIMQTIALPEPEPDALRHVLRRQGVLQHVDAQTDRYSDLYRVFHQQLPMQFTRMLRYPVPMEDRLDAMFRVAGRVEAEYRIVRDRMDDYARRFGRLPVRLALAEAILDGEEELDWVISTGARLLSRMAHVIIQIANVNPNSADRRRLDREFATINRRLDQYIDDYNETWFVTVLYAMIWLSLVRNGGPYSVVIDAWREDRDAAMARRQGGGAGGAQAAGVFDDCVEEDEDEGETEEEQVNAQEGRDANGVPL